MPTNCRAVHAPAALHALLSRYTTPLLPYLHVGCGRDSYRYRSFTATFYPLVRLLRTFHRTPAVTLPFVQFWTYYHGGAKRKTAQSMHTYRYLTPPPPFLPTYQFTPHRDLQRSLTPFDLSPPTLHYAGALPFVHTLPTLPQTPAAPPVTYIRLCAALPYLHLGVTDAARRGRKAYTARSPPLWFALPGCAAA